MRHEDGFFQGIRGARIYRQCWLPDGEPRAVLLIVHGLGEHSGRYANVVNHLVPRGYALYGLDHVGHGKSEGTREYVERFEDYTDTLDMYRGMVRQAQPDKPLFLYGHSLGGLISAFYLLDHQAGLAGAVLSAPPGHSAREHLGNDDHPRPAAVAPAAQGRAASPGCHGREPRSGGGAGLCE